MDVSPFSQMFLQELKKTFGIVFQNLKMEPFTDHLISGLLERIF